MTGNLNPVKRGTEPIQVTPQSTQRPREGGRWGEEWLKPVGLVKRNSYQAIRSLDPYLYFTGNCTCPVQAKEWSFIRRSDCSKNTSGLGETRHKGYKDTMVHTGICLLDVRGFFHPACGMHPRRDPAGRSEARSPQNAASPRRQA